MNSLLGHFAAQALGVAPRLRPATRLRPAAEAASDIGTEPVAPAAEPSRAAPPMSAPLARDMPARPHRHSSAEAAAQPDSNGPRKAAAPAAHPAAMQTLPNSILTPTTDGDGMQARGAPLPDRAALAGRADPSRSADAALAGHRMDAHAPAEPGTSANRMPSPLDEPRSAPALNRLPLSGGERRESRAPEVHVHIGRIEVVAGSTTPPQPSKRERRPAAPTLSLDDYLRSRAGTRADRSA